MKIFGDNFTTCPYIRKKKSMKMYEIDWEINLNFNCKSYNLVFAIICAKEKSNMAYIGKTKIILMFRFEKNYGSGMFKVVIFIL